MSPDGEARAILSMVGNDLSRAVQIVQNQLNVLHGRAQVLTGFSGIVVTVTGFSGRLIASTDRLAQILVIAGLAAVVLSAFYIFLKVMRLRWVTSELDDEPVAVIAGVIRRRNERTRALAIGGAILMAGLVAYVAAVALMLADPRPVSVPSR